jgi:SAM-dependent methyltransferase
MYSQNHADWYDLIYLGIKDYPAESAAIADLIRARRPEATSLLDVACGTGGHLRHLREQFSTVEGVDISATMLRVAADNVPGVPLHQGDMRDFDLGRRFDAVACLFSAIGYLRSTDELHAAVARMAAHLNPRGVLVVDSWLYPDSFSPGHLGHTISEADGRTVMRMSQSTLDGNQSRLTMHHLVGDAGGVRYFSDVHELTLFTRAEYESAFTAAGLREVTRVPGWSTERDRIIGTAPDEG